jgi:subtilisin-like proprotein convertase family protein
LGTAAASAVAVGGFKLPQAEPVAAQEFEAASSRTFVFGRQITFADLAPSIPYNDAFISVSGLRGTVVGVRVRLLGLQHQNLGDMNILLLAPNGNAVMLISDAGVGSNVDNLNLTFSETASTPLPAAGAIFSGDYAATNYPGSDAMPPNAPAPNRTAISQFTGVPWSEAVGPWYLFCYDKAVTAGGFLRNWTLEILTTNSGPVARNLVFAVEQGETLRVRRSELLRRVRDIDGDRLFFTPFRERDRLGVMNFRRNGSFVFEAKNNRTGRARFKYFVTDGEVIASGRIVIRVTPNGQDDPNPPNRRRRPNPPNRRRRRRN